MKIFTFPWTSAVAAVMTCLALTACNTPGRQPQLLNPTITPVEALPGDTVSISIEVVDRFEVVDEVVAVLVKAPKRNMPLKDDGVEPDITAGDGIWTASIDLPFMAPPGAFDIELRARDRHGNPVIIKTETGETPLLGQCQLVIVYPPESGLIPMDPAPQPEATEPSPDPVFEVEVVPAQPVEE